MPELVHSYPPHSLQNRIRAEFIEMPGLRLTLEQAQRLWSLDCETCRRVLMLLVEAKFLVFGSDRKYGRPASDSLEPRLQMTKALLPAGTAVSGRVVQSRRSTDR